MTSTRETPRTQNRSRYVGKEFATGVDASLYEGTPPLGHLQTCPFPVHSPDLSPSPSHSPSDAPSPLCMAWHRYRMHMCAAASTPLLQQAHTCCIIHTLAAAGMASLSHAYSCCSNHTLAQQAYYCCTMHTLAAAGMASLVPSSFSSFCQFCCFTCVLFFVCMFSMSWLIVFWFYSLLCQLAFCFCIMFDCVCFFVPAFLLYSFCFLGIFPGNIPLEHNWGYSLRIFLGNIPREYSW